MKTIVAEFDGLIINTKTKVLTEYRRISGNEALKTRRFKRLNPSVVANMLVCLECGSVVIGDNEGRRLHNDWHMKNDE